MSTKESKKYFIKDEALRTGDKDMFSYADMAEVLKKIIVTTKPPYNIAVIGKWGLGKSSLIHLVTDVCEKKKDEYLVQEINAWKYEKESLRKVFLKQLWQNMSKKDFRSFELVKWENQKMIMDELEQRDSVLKPHGKEKVQESFRRIAPVLRWGAFFLGVSALAMIAYKIIQYALDGKVFSQYIWTGAFWGEAVLSYCKNIATIWIIPVMVAFGKALLDDYRSKQIKKYEFNFPLESADEFVSFLEAKLQAELKKNKDLKIITVIDDLDRLSIEKIVEALDALKAFVGFDRCIFIVPFDDEIIKDALEKRRKVNFRDEEKNDIVESELILDKLFQFKLYLPPLLDFDIKEYAVNLVKQEAPDFLKDFCDEDTMTDLLRQIIIHADVSTPRQVKKLINAFINNALLAYEREASGKVQKGLLTSQTGLQQIAKVSVLQADFNHFYDTLLVDMSSIDTILHYQSSYEALEKDLPDCLREYFEPVKDNEDNVQYMAIKREYEPLINFLFGTKKYSVENIAPYLYLAQDDISRKTGDETQRRVINALKSGNIKTVWSLLEQKPNVAEVLCYYLASPGEDIEKALDVAINVYHLVAEEYQAELAKYIIIRTMEVRVNTFFYGLPAENYIAIAKKGRDLQFGERFMDRYLEILQKEKYYAPDLFKEGVSALVSHHADLTLHQREMLKDAISMALNSSKTNIKDFVSSVCVDDGELFRTYWGLLWMERLCAYMDGEGDFEDAVTENLKKSFRLLQEQSVNEMIEYLIPIAEYQAFLPTLNEILDGEMENAVGGTVKAAVDTEPATRLAEAVISCEFDKASEAIFKVLENLTYEVTEENAERFDTFTANFVYDDAMDDVLVYCGQKEAFGLLQKTIVSLIAEIFKNEKKDGLLRKVQSYLTEEQRQSLFAKLKTESEKVTNTSDMYERLLRIYEVLARDEHNAEALDSLISASLIGKFDVNYSRTEYCNFIAQVIGYVKGLLKQETIDKFVEVLIKRYANYRNQYLQMLHGLTGYISADKKAKLLPVLLQNVPQAEFEDVFKLIRDNEMSPTGDMPVKYRDFLVTNISTAQNPGQVLDALSTEFAWIPIVDQLIKKAVANERCDREQLVEVVCEFWNAAEDEAKIKEASRVLLACIHTEYEIVSVAFAKVNGDKRKAIMEQLSNDITENTTVEVLLDLARLARLPQMAQSSAPLLKRTLELALSHQNQLEAIVKLLKELGETKTQVAPYRDEFAEILAKGFTETTSDVLKDSILRAVDELKMKSQFKKLLKDEDLEYFKKWKG